MKLRYLVPLLVFLCAFNYFMGYRLGKVTADRWYAQHQPAAATPQIVTGIEEHDIRPLPHAPVILYALDAQTCEWGYVDDQREGHMYEGPCKPNKKVKLIPPIKVRTAEPVTGNLNGAYFSVCSGKIDGMQIGIDQNGKCLMPAGKIFSQAKPVASVEEPR